MRYRLIAYGDGPTLARPEFSSSIELLKTLAEAGIRMQTAGLADSDKSHVVYAQNHFLTTEQLSLLGLLPTAVDA